MSPNCEKANEPPAVGLSEGGTIAKEGSSSTVWNRSLAVTSSSRNEPDSVKPPMPSVNGIDRLTPPPMAACGENSEPAGAASSSPTVTTGDARVMLAAMLRSRSMSAGPRRTTPNEAGTSSRAFFAEALWLALADTARSSSLRKMEEVASPLAARSTPNEILPATAAVTSASSVPSRSP